MSITAIDRNIVVMPGPPHAIRYQAPETDGPSGDTEAVSVHISQTARRAADLTSGLPPLILDPREHMENAQARLKVVMQELGIPPGTKMDVSVSGGGRITVRGEHEKLAGLEEMLNNGDEFELRNSLIGAHSASMILRTATVVDMAVKAAGESPARADAYFGWARQQANHIRMSRFDLTYDGTTLTGELRNADGSKMAAVESLRLPA